MEFAKSANMAKCPSILTKLFVKTAYKTPIVWVELKLKSIKDIGELAIHPIKFTNVTIVTLVRKFSQITLQWWSWR